jgi:hypothetical protein
MSHPGDDEVMGRIWTVVLGLSHGNGARKPCSRCKSYEGYIEAHMVYSVVYRVNNQGTLVIDSTAQKYACGGRLLSYGLTEPL